VQLSVYQQSALFGYANKGRLLVCRYTFSVFINYASAKTLRHRTWSSLHVAELLFLKSHQRHNCQSLLVIAEIAIQKSGSIPVSKKSLSGSALSFPEAETLTTEKFPDLFPIFFSNFI
jgi:hypothetical protein